MCKDFYLVNEFSLLEEILEPLYDVYTKLENLRFKNKFYLSKHYYARLLACGSGKINSKDMIIPKNLVLLEYQPLFTLISDNLCANVVLEMTMRLNSYFWL